MKQAMMPLVMILLCLLTYHPVFGVENGRTTEYQVKAAFLYNFVNFVEWPETAFQNSSEPLVITILGQDPFGSVLDDLVKDKSINSRKIVIRRAAFGTPLSDSHLLYIHSSEKRHLDSILTDLRGFPVLTVSDMSIEDSQGVMMHILIGNDNRPKLTINVDATDQAKLKISSRLLRLAEIIRD